MLATCSTLTHKVTRQLLFAFLCAEHMPLDRTETAALCCLYASLGISPIVRISHPCAREAAKALDAGAQGIVVPYLETVEEVQAIVGAVHYRPIKGRLLRELISGRRQPAQKTQDFLRRFNRHHYVIIGVGSVAAYENLDVPIGVPGVDGVFMGPHDLTVSLQVAEEWGNPGFLRLVEDVIVRRRAANLGVGIHVTQDVSSLEQSRRFVAAGMNWILDGADVVHALHSLKDRRRVLLPQHETSRPTPPSEGPASCATVSRKAPRSGKRR